MKQTALRSDRRKISLAPLERGAENRVPLVIRVSCAPEIERVGGRKSNAAWKNEIATVDLLREPRLAHFWPLIHEATIRPQYRLESYIYRVLENQ